MVARAWSERPETKKWDRPTRERASATLSIARRAQQGGPDRVEEMFVQNDAVSVCLLLNRRTKTMRVIDFRAGPSHAKRIFVMQLAKREGMEKVYTLVERDELSTWVKLGFTREANIPGFYKRSDAFILGCDVAAAMAGTLRMPIPGEDDDGSNDEPSAAQDFAEKTVVTAKKHAKDLQGRPLPSAKLTQVAEGDVKKAVDKALRNGRALTAFETFGRDVEQRFFQISTRTGFELAAKTESQSCFGNTFLELLTGPKTEAERLATVSAVRTLCEKFIADGVVGCFAVAPSDDVALATAFVFNGFRRTGLLVNHVVVGDERKDVIVWSRKLANVTGE